MSSDPRIDRSDPVQVAAEDAYEDNRRLKVRLVQIENDLAKVKEDLGTVSLNTTRDQLEAIQADLRAAVAEQ